MKTKLIESIRQILINIILPIRRKKEEILSQFHFSIVFRISLNHLKLLLFYGGVFHILFACLYIGIDYLEYNNVSDEIKNELMDKDLEESSLVNPYADEGLSIRIVDESSNSYIYNDIEFDVTNNKMFFDHIYYNGDNETNKFIISKKENYEIDGRNLLIYYQCDMTDKYNKVMKLLFGMSIIYIIMVAIIIKRGTKNIVNLFDPIKEISASTNRLTVNNLHSERLNIEGTKNELKDLAAVINRMLDRIEVSYESQKQFVSNASHELRTPISVIKGYADLLHRWGKKDEEIMDESINAIKDEAKSMQDLVEKLLFLSRHDKKTLKLVKHRFNMKEIIEDMVKETNMLVLDKEVSSLILEDVIVYGDKQALKQGIRVFIDNAIKYTKPGDRIEISCENITDACVITVKDTGIGMTRKDVENIFDRFYRSDEVRNDKISGYGLGLSIAKLIIMGHAGKIKVRSQYTVGTSFIITIPNRN